MEQINFNIKKVLEQSLNIYHYGSFVYGTFTPNKSDIDYIVILPDTYKNLDKQQLMLFRWLLNLTKRMERGLQELCLIMVLYPLKPENSQKELF